MRNVYTVSLNYFTVFILRIGLFYGAMRCSNPERSLGFQQEFLNQYVSLPFDDEAALISGQIRATLAAAGTPIGPYDLQLQRSPWLITWC